MRKIKRNSYVLLGFISMFSLLSVRLYFLQVKPIEKVTAQYKNHQTENISDMNYMVLDYNGKDLMEYNKEYILVIDSRPFSLNNYEETLEDLMALNFIMKGENPDFTYTEVMKSRGKLYYKVSEDTYNKINKLNNIKGIYTYVYDKCDRKEIWAVSSMLSTIGSGSMVKDSFEDKLNNIIKNNTTPKKNFYLNESAIYNYEELSLNHNNKNIMLTVDKEIDDSVRNVLEKEENSKYDNIGVILLESETGKIKSMIQKDESQANINLGIEGQGFEPGSIFKLITYAVALEEALINPHDTYICTGDVCKVAHGSMTVNDALVKSCNDIFGIIGNEIGYEKMMGYCKKLKLNERILNLQSENKNETKGIMPKEEDGMNNFAIGQCMTVSPIQIIGAVNAIVNKGTYVKPYIIDSIVGVDDKKIENFESEKVKIFSETTSDIVQKSMIEVVQSGTGIKANIPGSKIGGKTGSGTSGKKNTHAWFIGTFELDDKLHTMLVFLPELVASDRIYVDGGETAAPIFKDIVKELTKK